MPINIYYVSSYCKRVEVVVKTLCHYEGILICDIDLFGD